MVLSIEYATETSLKKMMIFEGPKGLKMKNAFSFEIVTGGDVYDEIQGLDVWAGREMALQRQKSSFEIRVRCDRWEFCH